MKKITYSKFLFVNFVFLFIGANIQSQVTGAFVELRPTHIDLSSETSESAVLMSVGGYTSNDARYRLYNGSNQYNCWDENSDTYISSNSYSSGPQIPGTPSTNTVYFWIPFQRGSNNSTSASYRDRLGSAFSTNYQTVALPSSTSISTEFTLSGTFSGISIYNNSVKHIVLAFNGTTLVSAASTTPGTGAFSLKCPSGTTINKIEIRAIDNNLISSISANWSATTVVGTIPVSSCFASNLNYTETTINKIVGDAAFIKTATSDNKTTLIKYTSNNTAVAVVDETTGEVTVLTNGTAKITATQAAGTHAGTDYCAATAEYIINVATVAPTITITEVNIPSMSAFADDTEDDHETIHIAGANLTSDILLTIDGPNAEMFSVTTPLNSTGGIATITYNPSTPGTHTAILHINSSGASEKTSNLNGTAIWKPLEKPVIKPATSANTSGFTANWDAVARATEYQLNVFTKSGNGVINSDVGFEGSTTLPVNWSGDGYVQNTATNARTGTNYAGLNLALRNIRTDLINNPSVLNFYYRYSIATANNTVKVQISSDGNDWTDVGTYIATGSSATLDYLQATIPLNLTGNYYIQWIMTSRSGGSFYFDDVSISSGSVIVTPIIGSPFTVIGTNEKSLTGLNPLTTYYYTVIAKNFNVSSAISDEEIGSTLGTSASGLKNLNDVDNIRVLEGKVVFTAISGQKWQIFNSIGQSLSTGITVEGLNIITVSEKGIILVKVANKVSKVVL